MTARAPRRIPGWLVEAATLLLPLADRERYRQEFSAEMYEMPADEQLPHATQVVFLAWSLRSALCEPAAPSIRKNTVQDARISPLLCRLDLWHRWRPYSTADGSNRYVQCHRCGKDLPERRWYTMGTA